MSRARNAGFVAAVAEPIAEALDGEGVTETRHEEGLFTALGPGDRVGQGGQDAHRHRDTGAALRLDGLDREDVAGDVAPADADDVGAAKAGVEHQVHSKARHGADRVTRLQDFDLHDGPDLPSPPGWR